MICSKCSYNYDDESKVCPNCGTQAENAEMPNQSNEQLGASAQGRSGDISTAERNNVLSLVKKLCSSPAVLVALISYTAAFVISMYNNLFGGTDTMLVTGVSVETARVISILVSVISIAIMIPMLCGMWITYISAANRRSAGMSTAGLSIVKVIQIILLVSICVLVELPVILSLLFSLINAFGGIRVFASLVSVLFTILLEAGIFALIILYFTQAVKTINTIRNTILTGRASDDVSTFVAVMGCILSGYVLAVTFVTHEVFGSALALSLVSAVLELVSSFAFAVFIFKYKDSMRPLMYQSLGYNGPKSPGTSAMPPKVPYDRPLGNGFTGTLR